MKSGGDIGSTTSGGNNAVAPDVFSAKKAVAEQAFERARAEEARAQLQTLFDATLSSISDFVYTFDRDGRFVFVNQPQLNLWGLTLEEAVGKNFYDLAYPDALAAQLQGQIETVFQTAGKQTGETFYTSPTGQSGYYEYILQPVLAEDGAVKLVVGSTRDVTAGRQAEAALRVSEERQAFLLKLSDALRPLGDAAAIEREACRQLGEHLQADHTYYAEIHVAADYGVVRYDHVRNGGIPFVAEYRISDLGFVIPLYQRGLPVVVDDVFTSLLIPNVDRVNTAASHIAWIAVPVVKDGLLVGSFCTAMSGVRKWTEWEVALVAETAERVWAAVKRVYAEDARRESEARLQAMAGNLPGGAAFIVDKDLRYLLAEGEALRVAGFAPSDLVGKTIFDMLPPETAASYVPRIRHALAGESFSHEHEAHGTVFLSRGTPLRSADGEVYAVLVVSYDISERKRTETALRTTEERFRVMVEGAQDYAMFLLDLNGQFTFWSKGAERVFGWTEAEVLGKNDRMLYLSEDQAAGRSEKDRQQALTEGHLIARLWKQRKNGSRFWLDGVLMRLDDENNKPYGFAKVARDATDQKRGEEDLEAAVEAIVQANELLEARVKERTRELAETNERRQALLRQIVTAQEEERGRIARDLHDDTGQQVTALLLGLAALKANPGIIADTAVFDAVSELQRTANDVAQKSHRIALNLRPTALDDIGLMQALKNYTDQWSGWSGVLVALDGVGMTNNHNYTKRLAAEVETTIYRVVQEALTNVLRYAIGASNSQADKAAQVVSVLVQCGSHDVLTIIEDDGPGFDVEAVLNLPLGKRRLGLFGMQERARLAGGTLEIESEPGAGTTVFLRIPLPS